MIREYHERTGYAVGFKPAGGIRTREERARVPVPDEGRAGRPLAASRTCSASARARCSPTSSASSSTSSPAATPRRTATRCRLSDHDHQSPRSSRRWSTARRPRATRRRATWLGDARRARSATSSAARGRSPATTLRRHQPGDGASCSRRSSQGTSAGRRRRGGGGAQGAARRGRRSAAHARARHLYALARAVQKHSRLLAVLESHGQRQVRSARRATSTSRSSRGTSITTPAGRSCSRREFAGYDGVGVVGQIIPWNFPLLMLAWKVAPALAAGYTVVLKPAEFTPLTALLFAELAHEAGLPPGVLNVVTGDGETGAAIVEHPDVDKIAFTGIDRSRAASSARRRRAAARSSRSSWAARVPFIVFDDADLDSVVEGVVDAIWFNQGQVCCAGSRLLVQEGIAERLDREAARAHGEAARRLAARQGGGHGRDRRAGAARAHPRRSCSRAWTKAPTMWQPSWACPHGRLLLSADAVHRTCSRRRRSRRSRSSARCSWR